MPVNPVNYDEARRLLNDTFKEVEELIATGLKYGQPSTFPKTVNVIFDSKTQAYREVLLGCVLARIQNKSVNIRLPYVNLGKTAYNGRTLDERAVNPFLQENRIPCSTGPYLSTFRRSVSFDQKTRGGLRDKKGYDAFLQSVRFLERTSDNSALLAFLRYLLFLFAQLREKSLVPLAKVQRLSVEQI